MIPPISTIRLSYMPSIPSKERTTISTSHQAFNALFEHWDKATISLQESFHVLLLDKNKKALGIATLTTGGLEGTVVDIRQLMATVLGANAVAFVIAHNHPSGDTKPSDLDLQVTKKIHKAAKILGVQLVDHLIISPQKSYTSLLDTNLL